jgi:hypothetical protein
MEIEHRLNLLLHMNMHIPFKSLLLENMFWLYFFYLLLLSIAV